MSQDIIKHTLLTLISVTVTGIVGLIAYMIKRWIEGVRDEIKSLHAKHDATTKEITTKLDILNERQLLANGRTGKIELWIDLHSKNHARHEKQEQV